MYTSTKSSNKTENWFSPPRGRIIYGPALAEAPKQKAHETRLKMPFDKLIFRQERSFVIIHTHAKRSGPISKLRAVFIKRKKNATRSGHAPPAAFRRTAASPCWTQSGFPYSRLFSNVHVGLTPTVINAHKSPLQHHWRGKLVSTRRTIIKILTGAIKK